MAVAVFGFLGVLLGSLTTSVLAVYRERLTTRREQEARDAQYERDRKAERDTFQRDIILALQTAVTDLMRAVYQEQRTVSWPSSAVPASGPPASGRRPRRLGGPTPCCASSSLVPACSMTSCALSPPSCAHWQVTASGPRASTRPGSPAKASSPCRSGSTRSSLRSSPRCIEASLGPPHNEAPRPGTSRSSMGREASQPLAAARMTDAAIVIKNSPRALNTRVIRVAPVFSCHVPGSF